MNKKLTLLGLAIFTALLFLPLTVSAQPSESPIWIDGEQVGTRYEESWASWWRYNNNASVGSATVNGERVYNDDGTIWMYTSNLHNYGTITNGTVNGGWFGNYGSYSTIENATVNGGCLENAGGTIENATVNGGLLGNGGGKITNVEVNGGVLLNGFDSTIENVTVNDGELKTYGTLKNVIVNGGTLNSYYAYYGSEVRAGTIENVTVNGGTFKNYCYYGFLYDDFEYRTIITNITQNGGTVTNGNRIENMTYTAGFYNGQYVEYWGEWDDGQEDGDIYENTYTGLIGTLTLAGDSALNTGDWGNIENLVFDKDGNGVATLTAFADNGSFGFNGIKADYVDFTYGNISLDLTGFGGISELYDGFYLSTLFGATGFSGVENLSSFEVTWGNNSFWILNGDGFGKGWSIDSVTGFVSYEVPEPATLLMLGLATAGIPVVRRLRKGVGRMKV